MNTSASNHPEDLINAALKQVPSSLSELVSYFNQDKKVSIFEMGRGIKKISKSAFIDFEKTNSPWPYPFLRSAWFAVFFTNSKDNIHLQDNNKNYHIWFLKFPLDEQGKLIQASRDDFLNHFYAQISNKHELNFDKADNYVADSPYGFKPSEEKMANINAILKYQQRLLPSKYYQQVLDYIFFTQQQTTNKQDKHWHQWKNLGYQGLADLSCRLKNKFQKVQIEQQLTLNIQFLPAPMLNALSTCLEHHKLSQNLVASLVNYALLCNQADIAIPCLRAISASDTVQVNRILKQSLMGDYKSHIELLAVICGRCWQNLKEPWLMLLFLEALALYGKKIDEENEAFIIMVNDLMFIPGLREHVLAQFRNPKRSTQLTIAIGNFYSTVN